MKIINIIFDIFHKSDNKAKIGDAYITLGTYSTKIIDEYNIKAINSTDYSGYYSIIPFNFSPYTILTDEQVASIEKAYKNYSENSKYREEFEFIKCYKVINNNLYNFYNHVKDLEFIPKTYDHLHSLYKCIENKSF